jgi:hypothetical protein
VKESTWAGWFAVTLEGQTDILGPWTRQASFQVNGIRLDFRILPASVEEGIRHHAGKDNRFPGGRLKGIWRQSLEGFRVPVAQEGDYR